ncbi:Sjogren's syndrome/scleroderma autoantigen 1 family protein [Natronorubrum thiooxidans]|uniref:Sjogren's syndrome/scleroderma autoantigen 1 (Autoantigen p27) n=1 Tax=Natronorubrum thiooxidans TaxID=308853 RepID=A0A1N7F0Q7_9EURY|nr:Sjogren's syndrome/scleroderma autoantigen 1 family protein [Natronorubrum thiooxidans]SIR93963.1 Sjogren's syndrome/scleroderma autoantigen 1 (Autoantigen p27) [Natronorubrum thiooxidans]
MSDFDKEAEREKLREKYERDKQERQATQRMSDLLLKGATMTNSHCGTCGDPLFQQDGTTFCPSCHGNPDAVEGTNLEAQPAEESSDRPAATELPAHGEDREPAAESGSTDDEAAVGDRDADDQPQQPAETPADKRHTRATDSPSSADASDRDEDASATETQPQTDTPGRNTAAPATGDMRSARRPPATSPSASGDLEAAHASLVQALEKFAAEAAATDDPRYATECLEAAREASETLETLR